MSDQPRFLRVVAVHPADQPGHVGTPVAVAVDGVVHVHLLDGPVVARMSAAQPLVGAPRLAAAQVRPRSPARLGLLLSRSRHRQHRLAARLDQRHLEATDRRQRRLDLYGVTAAHPDQLGARAGAPPLLGRGVGDVRHRLGALPGAPSAVGVHAHPEPGVAGRPGEADHREPCGAQPRSAVAAARGSARTRCAGVRRPPPRPRRVRPPAAASVAGRLAPERTPPSGRSGHRRPPPS